MRLEVPAGAGGWGEFAVGVDGGDADVVVAHGFGHEDLRGGELGLVGLLELVVSHEADAEVSGVLVFDVCALPDELPALPDAASGIDEEVVADVAEIALAVRCNTPIVRCGRGSDCAAGCVGAS